MEFNTWAKVRDFLVPYTAASNTIHLFINIHLVQWLRLNGHDMSSCGKDTL